MKRNEKMNLEKRLQKQYLFSWYAPSIATSLHNQPGVAVAPRYGNIWQCWAIILQKKHKEDEHNFNLLDALALTTSSFIEFNLQSAWVISAVSYNQT